LENFPTDLPRTFVIVIDLDSLTRAGERGGTPFDRQSTLNAGPAWRHSTFWLYE
jgi:hypothetical protein